MMRGAAVGSSAEQFGDRLGAEPDLFVVRLAELDVVVDVEMTSRIAVLIEPYQRRADDEEDTHLFGMIIGDERVALAGALVDEVAGGRGPVVLEITPLSRDRVGEHLMWVI